VGGHVVVAPDKFKGSLNAAEVAREVADGLRAAVPGLDVREHPVADGGDGTVEAALSAGYARREVRCTGPTGEPVMAALAVRDQVAVVELAEASGLRRLPGGRPAATTATSRGTGELIRAALDLGCRQVVLDDQTLRGKAPAGVAAAARAAGVPTVAVAGRSTLDPAALEPAGIARVYLLSDLEPDPERSMRDPAPLLRSLAGRIAADWLGWSTPTCTSTSPAGPSGRGSTP